MSQKIVAVLILTSILFVTEAMAGPFGLEKGMSLEDIGGNPIKISDTGHYMLSSVPKPHSAFETYIVRVAPTGGLFWIRAVGKEIRTNSYGIELKSAFVEIEEKLKATYGKNTRLDSLLPGSAWNKPNQWMMGLIKTERVLMSLWLEAEGSTLPPDLRSIGLMAVGASENTGKIHLEYEFSNRASCEAELVAQEDNVL